VKTGWEVKALGEIATLGPAKKEVRQELEDADEVSFAPMDCLNVGKQELSSHEARPLASVYRGYTYFRDGDVLLAKITPCFENGKLGVARHLFNGVGFGSSEFFVIRPKPGLVSEYVYYVLRQKSFRDIAQRQMTGAVGHKRVPKQFLKNLPIPLPPLGEQQRIVAILDEAFEGLDRAQANAEANLASAEELSTNAAAAVFENLMQDARVQEAPVKKLALPRKGSIRTGPFGSQLLHSEFVDKGIAVLGIDNAVANEFRWDKRRFITAEKFRALERYTVHPGDVIITIMGTCGRCAIIPDDIPVAINTKHLCCISLNQEKCVPEYLQKYFLFSPTAKSYLEAEASGAVMDGLNMGIIKELPVYYPCLERQQEIVSEIEKLQSNTQRLISIYEAATKDFELLRQVLLQRAFAGELT
jgi:type I restriction enzyme S subunit